MTLAVSLLMLAAAAAPQGAQAALPPAAAPVSEPARPEHRGVVATATATAVILRPAMISFAEASTAPDGRSPARETIYRQTSRQGRHVSIDFN